MRRIAVLILALNCLAGAAHAQSLRDIAVGDPETAMAARKMKLIDTSPMGLYVARKYPVGPGLFLSATSSVKSKRIVFVEIDWTAGSKPAPSGAFGFNFGKTTLADIRKAMGFNGMAYKDGPNLMVTDDGLVLANTYELDDGAGTLVTFVTLIGQDALDRGQIGDPAKIGRQALLVSVILSEPRYLAEIWGSERLYDKVRKKIRWRE